MNIDEFEYLKDNCDLKSFDGKHVFFLPIKPKSAKIADKIIKDNHLENLTMEEMSQVFRKFYPLYQSKKGLKQHQFSLLSTQEVADLPIEKKLEYMEALFYASQTVGETMNICEKNEENIRVCLFNMDFPQSFWKTEKETADRYVAMVASQPEITDKMKNWSQTTLEEKKSVVSQAAKIFEYVYNIKVPLNFFSPEEKKAKNRALGLPEDTHIEGAYQKDGEIFLNEERLQDSDNFFAMSVVFHEATHLRQHSEVFKDPLVERILNCSVGNATYYEDKLNDKDSVTYRDLYAMQPSEKHAYGLQEYVENEFTEKTGITKALGKELDAETKKIHNKTFSMAKLAQYHSSKNK